MRTKIPQKDRVYRCLEGLWHELFPAHYPAPARFHLRRELTEQACRALENQGRKKTDVRLLIRDFLKTIPQIREKLCLDAQAARDRDPAVENIDEVILAYPGFLALMTYRLAHELACHGIPMIPRMMSSAAQSRTGCDIHPEARIGEALFIDHATGVVIGQTSVIGNRVTIFQGVTLGATVLEEKGQSEKRHPTIEDDVILYSNATILGGKTVIGKGSVIGGSCWITFSVAPYSRIMLANPRSMLSQSQKNVEKLPSWDI